MKVANLIAKLTCPHCGHCKQLQMPTHACLWFYECELCQTMLSPLAGDCCVFCSYADMECPPKQLDAGCCASDN
ncbi:GDCCVxC domain-containing (seleno)protein [Shewanella denitrificans]|nr:GDCCVxC domain-containing (seleno)protein [Shewanella denitrificans]